MEYGEELIMSADQGRVHLRLGRVAICVSRRYRRATMAVAG